MTHDPVASGKTIWKGRAFNAPALIVLALVFAGSYFMFLREFAYQNADLYIHAMIAHDFDFTDLHSITSRLSYPVWHIVVSALYQLGVPLGHAAAGVCALCKAVTFLLTYWLVGAMAGERANRWAVLGLSAFLMIVTGVLVMSVSDAVYRGVGSPNVWHNPTQQTVTAAMMLVMPWLAHCWYEFARQVEAGKQRVLLPWWKIVVLAVLCMGSVACKPTFMQALLPAAFVMYLVEVFRHKKEWRYFGQIVLAFLPSVGYFLLSYLYYTGVVVEFTSGVEVGITVETAWVAVRNTLMMSAHGRDRLLPQRHVQGPAGGAGAADDRLQRAGGHGFPRDGHAGGTRQFHLGGQQQLVFPVGGDDGRVFALVRTGYAVRCVAFRARTGLCSGRRTIPVACLFVGILFALPVNKHQRILTGRLLRGIMSSSY